MTLATFAAAARPYAATLVQALAPATPYLTAAIRAVLLGAGGSLVTSGALTRSQEEQVVGYAMAGAGFLWSQWQKRHAAGKLAAATAAPAGLAKPPAV